jgi:hypothetical protein
LTIITGKESYAPKKATKEGEIEPNQENSSKLRAFFWAKHNLNGDQTRCRLDVPPTGKGPANSRVVL